MKVLLLGLFLLLTTSFLSAQTYSGVSESQYSGYLGTTINPANIVNPNYKADIHLASFNASLVNDYLVIRPDSLFSGEGTFFERFEDKNSTSNYANAIFDLEVNWAGAMISLNDKIGIGFGVKSRALINIININKDLIQMAASGLEDSTYYGVTLRDEYMSFSAASWNEYALYFGMKVLDAGAHKLTLGGALNILQSNGSFYLHADDINYEFQDEDTIANVSGRLTYGGNYSQIPSNLVNTFTPFNGNGQGNGNFGLSMDIGATYEFRPSGAEDYLLKVGLAFHDIGFIAATPENSVSNTIVFNFQDIDVNFFDGIQDFDEINSYVVADTTPYNYQRHDRELMMQAPTRLNLFVDYHVIKGLYVSFLSDIALYRTNNGERIKGINSFELTPRYDFKWFGFALPISYIQYAGFDVGLGLRLGPVYLGSGSLIRTLNSSNRINSANFYAGLRIPIHNKKS